MPFGLESHTSCIAQVFLRRDRAIINSGTSDGPGGRSAALLTREMTVDGAEGARATDEAADPAARSIVRRCCNASALFVCLTVALLFVADSSFDVLAGPLAALFIFAMALLIAGLILFLYELQLSMRALRLRSVLVPVIGDGSG